MKRQAVNPYLPLSEYIPDGEAHVFGDRVYLFGSHDRERGDTYCMLDYTLWSAPVDDLSDWSCSGIIYSPAQDPLYGEEMKYLYAPDVVQGNDGRYYLYYCMAGWRGRGGYGNPISVAVCDRPDGRYEYLGIVRNPDGTPLLRHLCFDPAVIRDEGTIRLYFGTNYPWFDRMPRLMRETAIHIMSGRSREQIRAVPEGIMGAYHVELEDDMLTAHTSPVRIDSGISGEGYVSHSFFEGASIRKIGGIYYFVWSSIKNHELCYATSPFPDRGFVFGGTIVSTGDVGLNGRRDRERLNHTGTTHGCIEKVGDQCYVFYHRLTHNSDYCRQACAEPITISPDHSIAQAEVTSCGLNRGPLDASGVYMAAICCNLTNGHMRHGSNGNRKSKEPCMTSDGKDQYLTGIRKGTLAGYKYFDFHGDTTVSVRYRGSGGALAVLLSPDLPPVAQIPLSESGGWTDSPSVTLSAYGTHPLYFRYLGRGSIDLMSFELEDA
ncbi:MAG: family 43 glycosylhydrolase [Clostridia bacterium]|nr:family 43 glycosylhydrolase [Clostridia bacterium]